MNEIETRRYKITATKEQLDILETLFNTMQTMGSVGSSRTIKLYVDGDGAFRPKFEKFEKGETAELKDLVTETNGKPYNYKEGAERIKHGYGVIAKNCDEFNGEGFYIYYDFG